MITTHLSADFDAFSAAVCAVRLYPGYRVLFPGSQGAAVRRFLTDTGLPFPELKLRQARREELEHAVVVDTRSGSRLGEAWELINRDSCPVTIIDHHSGETDDLGADEVIFRDVGATCTILSQILDERDLVPSAEEASLLLMGIYEDTGGLSYRDTTPHDLRAVAWLLEHGGSLSWVRRWVMKGLQPEQLELLNRLVAAAETIRIADVPVSIALVEVDRYLEEAAYVVHRWVETFEIPVGIVMLVRPPFVNLILRARVRGLDIGQVAQHFGGGGHATAASARVSGRMPIEIREELLRVLEAAMPPPVRAADVATRRIFSVPGQSSVADAKERINRLRVNALPVEADGGGPFVGTVTRQVLDRALAHGMAGRPVSQVMLPDVPVVDGSTALTELRDLFLERSHRFVIVEEEARPIGLVTRMDLFRHLFERQHRAGEVLDHRMAGARPVSQPVGRVLREGTPEWARSLLDAVAEVAAEQRADVYLVGGMVRDLLLGRHNEDVDLVVEGDGIAFADALVQRVGGRCHAHRPFLTAVITLPDGHSVDVASARTEFYRTPAALPEVATSLIRQDLFRRDFTVNALAIRLSGERHGYLVDFFGGRKDLDRREIRVLHSLSFIDDPTRAIRAVRYARRLGFTVASDTRHLIGTAITEEVFDRLSGQRLRRELEQLLAEPHPTPSIALLAELGLLPALSPDLEWSEEIRLYLLDVEGQLAWLRLEELGDVPEPWFLFLGALLLSAPEGAAERLADRLQLTGDRHRRMAELPAAVARLREVAEADVAASERVVRIESEDVEPLLLAMAGVEKGPRRRLADAVEAAHGLELPVRGADLLEAGLDPGPHIGLALRATRAALVDGEIDGSQARRFALDRARELAEAGR